MSQSVRNLGTPLAAMAFAACAVALGACSDTPTEPVGPTTAAFDEVEGPTCSVGLWKNDLSLWNATPYDPSALIGSVFQNAGNYAGESLSESLDFAGGPGPQGAIRLLLRAAVVALLNDAYPGNDIDYGADLIPRVEDALAGSRRGMLRLASELEAASDVACAIVAGPGLPDLVITQIELIGASDWRATVLNQGTATADVANVVLQGWASDDSVLDSGDAPACGMSLSQTATTLAPGETATAQPGCMAARPTTATVLFIELDRFDAVVESDETNNVGVVSLL